MLEGATVQRDGKFLVYDAAHQAMAAAEGFRAEARLRRQPGTAQRDGRTHQVRHQRNLWYWLAPGHRTLVVVQAHHERVGRLCCTAALDGKWITGEGGTRLIDDPIEAMLELERLVQIDDVAIGAQAPLILSE